MRKNHLVDIHYHSKIDGGILSKSQNYALLKENKKHGLSNDNNGMNGNSFQFSNVGGYVATVDFDNDYESDEDILDVNYINPDVDINNPQFLKEKRQQMEQQRAQKQVKRPSITDAFQSIDDQIDEMDDDQRLTSFANMDTKIESQRIMLSRLDR